MSAAQGIPREQERAVIPVGVDAVIAEAASDAARLIGMLGAAKGGKARARRITKNRREMIAMSGAIARHTDIRVCVVCDRLMYKHHATRTRRGWTCGKCRRRKT